MINILIDGNYIFHKTFGVFAGYGNVDPGKILKEKKDQAAFVRKVATDLCASLKMLPLGGRLVFTTDSRSWRKDVEIEDGGYKSGRVKDEAVDWTIFFELLTAFGNQLEKMGFIFSKKEGAEGDDLLMFWSDYFNGIGEDCLIISGDHDMHQLSRVNEKAWTTVWNTNSKKNIIAVPMGWVEAWLNKSESVGMSIFNMGSAISTDKERFKDFVKKVNVEEIATHRFILNKVLIGDAGDSVPSVWEYKVKDRNGEDKLIRFTPAKASKAYELFMESKFSDLIFSDMLNNKEFLLWFSGVILRTTKDIDSTENRKKAADNIVRNFKLMWLDPHVIPDFVSNSCYDEIHRGTQLPRKSITIDRIKILDGTEWASATYQPKGFDPFENFI